MKTIEALFMEMVNSEELKKSFGEAVNSGDSEAVAKWIADQGCDATAEEITAFFKEMAEAVKDGELNPDQLEGAAGGTIDPGTIFQPIQPLSPIEITTTWITQPTSKNPLVCLIED